MNIEFISFFLLYAVIVAVEFLISFLNR